MKKNWLILALAVVCTSAAHAQYTSPANDRTAPRPLEKKGPDDTYDKGALGLGIGFDYGGFGINYTLYPQRNIGIFGGVGYAIAGVGYNVGTKFRLTPKKVTPFITGMYGYNTAIKVTGTNGFGPSLNKIFYGFTAGGGVDILVGRESKNYISIALMVPFRGSDVDDYINSLESSGVVFKNKPAAVGVSIGLKIATF